MNIAVIPARGGSVRIPRKNIRLFRGRPLIAYSIEAAAASNLFARVLVSTDDDEIAEIAARWGAEVPFRRPRELADAYTGTADVVRHAVETLEARGARFAFVCCIYATAPFLQPRYLQQGLDELTSSPEKDFAFAVTTFPFPIQRAIRVRRDNGIEPFFPDLISRRSQDLEEAYHDAGQFYWGKPQAFVEGRPLFGSQSVPVVLPRHLVQDIDTEEDWVRAELMHAALRAEAF